MLILAINVTLAGGGNTNFKIWDSPNNDSTSGATVRYVNDGGIASFLNAVGEKQTIGPIRISTGNYCVIEVINATNNLNVINGLAWVVERG